ncbi:hypothetical protein [Glaciecola sp. MF2-115]|uniref:hypothetical protein n=1 Tax=Glaciecola sp. MF2-115 TaxID=3384827 RepID=UPI0039A08353
MKNHLMALCVLSVAFISGCSTYATNRYSISADNVVALKNVAGNKVAVGAFGATTPGVSSIMCRGVGPIKTPDGESFENFVRNALISEMKIADVYSDDAGVKLTGNLDKIDFSSASGKWTLGVTLNSSNGNSLSVTEDYEFTTSFYGETACNQTGQALMPAVQNVITKLVSNPEFTTLVN